MRNLITLTALLLTGCIYVATEAPAELRVVKEFESPDGEDAILPAVTVADGWRLEWAIEGRANLVVYRIWGDEMTREFKLTTSGEGEQRFETGGQRRVGVVGADAYRVRVLSRPVPE